MATLYGARATSLTTSDLYTINPATGAATSVGPIGYAVTGLAFDPTDGTLYGSVSNNSTADPASLITIDPVTGAGTLVGSFGSGAMVDLAFDAAGTLYGWSGRLYTVNKATGAATHVPASPIGLAVGSALAFASGGVLWQFGDGDAGAGGSAYTVNKVTGVWTLAEALSGYDNGSGSGRMGAAAFDSGDVLYAADSRHDLPVPNVDLVTIDTATGVVTLVGASVTGLDALAWSPGAAPPPDHTVTFDANGGSGTMAPQVASSATALTANSFTRAGFTFAGWNSAADGSGTAYADGDVYPFGSDVTLYAQWAIVGRVLIALDDTALEESPTWTRIDDTPNLVSGIDIRRGRQTETDQTDASTATVYLNDTSGDFDMHNTLSPYWGKLVGHQILLQLRNAVTGVWEPQTRMTIDDLTHDFNPATNAAGEPLVANVALECVDLFDYLAGVEMIPGLFGDIPPAGSERTVFYEDTTGGDGMQTRLTQLAADANIPAGRTRFFTGNVDLQETKYDPAESLLVAMRDAVEAEFPDIANLATDRHGILFAHGRLARFTPEAVAAGTDWDFRRWKAGDGAAIALDSDRAQIRPPLAWARPRSRIVNAAMCTPKGIVDADVPGQIVSDSSSITAYGYRSWSGLGLIVKHGATTGFTAKGECKSFAHFKVDNYKDPHTRVEAITFKSLRPDDPRAASTWDLLCAVDISDVIELTHGYPGGVGMTDEPFYVEGMETTIRPLGDFDMVEKTVNVSPASAYPPGYVFSDA